MARQSQLNAEVDPELAKALKIRLIQDDLTYRAWLERQIREYLSGTEQPKTAKQRALPRKQLIPRS